MLLYRAAEDLIFLNKRLMQLGFGMLRTNPTKKNDKTHAKSAALVWVGFEPIQKSKSRNPVNPVWQWTVWRHQPPITVHGRRQVFQTLSTKIHGINSLATMVIRYIGVDHLKITVVLSQRKWSEQFRGRRSWIFPYSKLFSKSVKIHSNVEYCNSVKSIK